MDLLNSNKNNSSYNYCQNHRIICCISLGFAVVEGREKFHETNTSQARYKTALPFLEKNHVKNVIQLIAKSDMITGG